MQNLGKPELEKVWQRRKPDADGKLGPIRADRVTKSKSSCGGELEKQLARRTQLLDQVSRRACVRAKFFLDLSSTHNWLNTVVATFQIEGNPLTSTVAKKLGSATQLTHSDAGEVHV